MSRRLPWITGLAAAVLLAVPVPAAAVGPFGAAEVLISSYEGTGGDAAISVDGTTRGFATRAGAADPIWFFRSKPGLAPSAEQTPYTGTVLSVAWDGAGSTYVVFRQATQLKIGKRVEDSGAYAPATTLTTTVTSEGVRYADVVASGGRWWTVWAERVDPSSESSELFQRHTLLGVQGRTRITSTASNIDDLEPSLAYASGRLTMVWSRAVNPGAMGSTSDLWIAASNGGAWSSRPFATLGARNDLPDVIVYAGITWVTWTRLDDLLTQDRIVVANNSGGSFQSRTFATPGGGSTIAASGSNVFVAWQAADRAYLAQLSAGAWTGSQVTAPPSSPLRVVAQGTKARIVYDAANTLYIRSQA